MMFITHSAIYLALHNVKDVPKWIDAPNVKLDSTDNFVNLNVELDVRMTNVGFMKVAAYAKRIIRVITARPV